MRKYLMAAVAVLALAVPANAATFKPIAKGKSLVMTGMIVDGDGDKQRFVSAYNASCHKYKYCPERLFLNSDGGEIHAAFKIAIAVDDFKLDTVVGKTDACVSACFYIWAAGKTRVYRPTSAIGVHNVRTLEGKEDVAASRVVVDILRKMGVPEGILLKMLMTPPTEVAWLTADDVKGWAKAIN